MKNPKNNLQSTFSIDVGRTIENYMVLVFTEGNQIKSIVVRFPDWFRFYDQQYRYYIFSDN